MDILIYNSTYSIYGTLTRCRAATLSSTNNAYMTERRHKGQLIIWVGNVLYQIIL